MANGSVANGKAKSPTPATNPIGKCFSGIGKPLSSATVKMWSKFLEITYLI